MADTKDCKVFFHTLIQRMHLKQGETEAVVQPFYNITEVLRFVTRLPKKNKFYDLKDNKFCFLESVSILDAKPSEHVFITGVFKSARNEFRPDLINKRTGVERKNPKELAEGDIEKTHFLIKIDLNSEEVFFLLEFNFFGVHINNVINYFSVFNKQYLEHKKQKRTYSVKYTIIPRDNFLSELRNLNRTTSAEVFFNKKLLGSSALNFSNRQVSLKRDLKLTIVAEAKQSITEVGIDLFNKLNTRDSAISKVRIHGKDQNNNEILLDTSFMEKTEFVKVHLNPETGEVNSTELFSGLTQIANSL